MDTVVWTYIAYLVISFILTVWVGMTIQKHGRVFLMDVFLGKESFAEAVNHLLVVGFYIITFGYVTLGLRYGAQPATTVDAIEFVSTKIGLVALILGGTHFFNLYAFSRVRRRAPFQEVKEPPEEQVATASAAGEADLRGSYRPPTFDPGSSGT